MKRLARLSVVALMLASAVFAPLAIAQEPGEVDIQSVTLGPEGSVQVTGTIECLAGSDYTILLEVRQAQGNQPVRFGNKWTDTFICQTTGPESFTDYVFPEPGSKPFRKGEVVVSGVRFFCGSINCNNEPIGVEAFQVR